MEALALAEALERRFGADWRRGMPLPDAVVAAFEAEHGVALPDDYRAFLTSLADGALGPPHYGLVALGEPSEATGHRVQPGSLRAPFPLTEAWLWEGEPAIDRARLECVHRDGFVPLGTDGCGMDYALIVSGPARGQVWMITGEGAFPVAPDFASWVAGDVFPDAAWTLGNGGEG